MGRVGFFTLSFDFGLPDRQEIFGSQGLVRHGILDTVENLVLQEHDGVRIPDGGFEETLAIL